MSEVKWEVKKLGEVCEMYQPKTISKKDMIEDGKYPVFGANGVIGRFNKFNHELPQLLLTCRGATCGAVNVSLPKSWINGNAMVIKPKSDKLNFRFLEYLLIGGIDLTKSITGAAQPQITRQSLIPIEIKYPQSTLEQQRIVSLLDEAFEAINQAKANAEKNLENAKELFESYRDSFFYSKEWEVKLLGDVCTHVEYGTSSKSDKQGEVPVLRMGNIQNGFIDWEDLVYTNNKDEINRYLLKYNDVLFNRTNSYELVGKTAIYKGESPAIFAGYLIRIHRNEKLLDADYLNYYLNSKKASEYGKTVVTSSVNQANINGTKLKSYPIPLPPIEVQQSIVSRLDNIRLETLQLESQYQTKLENLEELRKSILEKAFNGEL